MTWRKRGELHRARAGAEVLLAAGAINSPHLLQVSGIGPAAHLATIGVEVVHDLPGVGEGLQDHFATRVAHRVTRPVTLNERARPWRLGWEIATWLVGGNGLLAFSPAHVGAFLRSRPGLEQPDLQFVFTPASYNEGGVTGGLESLPGMTCGVWQLRPESRGHVRARSPDSMEAPAIQPNYLATETDWRAAIDGIRWARRLLGTAPLAPFRGKETVPSDSCQDEEALLAYARARGSTVYHAVGTCRMGADPLAAVRPDLVLHGMSGLRVVDASVMPTMVSGNTNAATLMIAEKAADLILASRDARTVPHAAGEGERVNKVPSTDGRY